MHTRASRMKGWQVYLVALTCLLLATAFCLACGTALVLLLR